MTDDINHEQTTGDPLHFEIRPHASTTTGFCQLCGRTYRQAGVIVKLCNGGEDVGDICPRCVAAGPEGARQRVLEFARRLSDNAMQLASLGNWIVGERKLPTVKQLFEVLDATAPPSENVSKGMSSASGNDLSNVTLFPVGARRVASLLERDCANCAECIGVPIEGRRWDDAQFRCLATLEIIPFVDSARAKNCDSWKLDSLFYIVPSCGTIH